MSRKNRQVESRMVSEYLLARYSKEHHLSMVPLGAIDDQLAARVGMAKAIGISRPFRPEVDAIVILPRHLLLIEAKVFKVVDGLAKLPLYASLVPSTPELRQYMPREILMQLVVGWTNPNLDTMAAAAGVQVAVFSPPWLDEEVRRQHNYWTADYQRERQRKQQLREYLGVE